MKERGGPWRLWILSLLVAGSLCIPVAECQSRGDEGTLGFDDVLRRHDGYVKGETPTIPETSFRCSAQPYNPGMYADTETQCQVYHVCFEDRQESFLCGPGTNFNQRILACDFWYNFDCADSPSFYNVNADIGKVPDPVYNQGQSRNPTPQQPNYPRIPNQPPSVGSIPSRVSIPSPPPQRPEIQRPEEPVFQPQPQRPVVQRPQQPSFQPQPQRPVVQRPQQPSFQPQPPVVQRPQQPSFQPQPQRPVVQRPQQPSFQPQQPIQPQPPRVQPQPPRPQPPRVQPQPPYVPQPRPEPPRINEIKPEYPSQGSGHGQGGRRPNPPSIQQEEDDGYQFDGYNPQKPVALPPPPQPHPQTPRPQFPPVVTPPRVSRPPLTPPVVRQPEPSISRPRIPEPSRPDYHPDCQLKGGCDYQPPRQPQPSRPVGSGYPSYPVPQPRPIPEQRPIPQKPVYVPPPAIQQENVEPEYIPPPPPRRRVDPPKPVFKPPPPPVQQEVTIVEPPKPQRPYVPPQIPQKPIDEEYRRPQPSIVREQQKPASRPQPRPQVSTGSRQPQRPKPVFPPPSDHPYSNIKGGPGYNQPPPQVPRFEPTRIGRPSAPVPVRPSVHDTPVTALKPVADKRPSPSTSGGYKVPQQDRIKKPSEPPKDIYQPPIQVVDHPRSEIKGGGYPSQHQQRVKSPSTPVSGVKVPQPRPKPQQRPRAPVVVSRPQPPAQPATSIKTVSPSQERRVKQPSQIQSVSRPSQPRFPSHQPIDHPNSNIKGGYDRPSAPSTSYEQKTKTNVPRQPSGSGYPSQPAKPSRGDYEPAQQDITQHEYKPQRIPQATKTVSSGVKTRPQAASQRSFQQRQPKPEYDAGTSYTEGPNVYPKPQFGQYQPISTPSRSSVKTASPSQNTITQAQNKPDSQRPSVASGSGRGVPGYQPPYQPQVFPHRENPDHPNESLKGSNAYRPPPPAGFQGAASEISETQAKPEEPEPATSLLGDIGAE
ncbi:hypothetical protein JTE90_009749 [Oedothorax gibbosus]|uniref:Chitin-binding type-2 domain-containing protein n=1 Tax=Oedothorax gibbosus TaxID=931172 RepID=A0AAV6V8X5_9ARAC|nr:hypothetical protein JTE90_009749 [Oedothorax gibbosus]